ncbi:H+-transporting ATPase [Fonticula alba]|uniref:P-type H(+)-exporting transporter n=1 Tax=Fonticula alba TaxID=691883 RepID=A0A058Z719_FONAL|nr:H+-transporting ATPase [Fonticula alba]KCV69327.1 H+-transporting ATPase [Fonticula alba]|eukprot:XP_009495892.1 H+-transporting ATPase [Fonticula alba]
MTAAQNDNLLALSAEDAHVDKLSLDEVMHQLKTNPLGLSDDEAARRLAIVGPNQITEKTKSPILVFLGFMWNPLSWAMECAAILAIILLDYVDFGLIIALLFINSTIGFLEERSAGNAIAALKAQLAPEARVLRNRESRPTPANQIVPGDVIRVKAGDVLPADVKLLNGDEIKVDQSSLTGESLPVTKKTGDTAFSGSIVRQGEIEAVVYATGSHTFLGRAAALISTASTESNLQHTMTIIGNVCLVVILMWVTIVLLVQLIARGSWTSRSPLGTQFPGLTNLYGPNRCRMGQNRCPTLNNILILIVGGIPIAMPTVLSVTMAIGASKLSQKQAIVSRLTAVEELAAMDVLCSDKTGTLTLNELSINNAEIYAHEGATPEDVLFDGALCARTEDADPIDTTIVNALTQDQLSSMARFRATHYVPFDPVGKRTIVTLVDCGPAGAEDPAAATAKGAVFRTAKGAPQIILDMAHDADLIRPKVMAKVNEFASRGYRSVAVARSTGAGPLEQASWNFVGMIPLYDPPRHDTAQVVAAAIDMGIAVKMITGDQLAIARESCRQMGLSTDVHTARFLDGSPSTMELLRQGAISAIDEQGTAPPPAPEAAPAAVAGDKTVDKLGDPVPAAAAAAAAAGTTGKAVPNSTDTLVQDPSHLQALAAGAEPGDARSSGDLGATSSTSAGLSSSGSVGSADAILPAPSRSGQPPGAIELATFSAGPVPGPGVGDTGGASSAAGTAAPSSPLAAGTEPGSPAGAGAGAGAGGGTGAPATATSSGQLLSGPAASAGRAAAARPTPGGRQSLVGGHLAAAYLASSMQPVPGQTTTTATMGPDYTSSGATVDRAAQGAEEITIDQLVEKSDGFAEVYPQHKHAIVKRLQRLGHVVGMTGDGVNDAPALKQADIGIAVAGSTDAARAASDIVLLSPGLGVIIDAIIGARKIFQRMKSYATYAVATTVRITFTFGLLATIFDWYFPTILVVIMAILNDGTMLTIAKDLVRPSKTPDSWRLTRLFPLAFLYGLYLTASTLVLFRWASTQHNMFTSIGLVPVPLTTYEGQARLRAIVYLHVSLSGQLLLFITRSRSLSFMSMPHPLMLLASVVAQVSATFIGVYGFNGYPDYNTNRPPGDLIWGKESFLGCGWGWAVCVWIWTLCWYIPLDVFNMLLHRNWRRIFSKVKHVSVHGRKDQSVSRAHAAEAHRRRARRERDELRSRPIEMQDF